MTARDDDQSSVIESTPEWLIKAETFLSTSCIKPTGESTEPAEGTEPVEPTAHATPTDTTEPASANPVAGDQDALTRAHFDTAMLAVSSRLTELERLLAVRHTRDAAFPDDPAPSSKYRTRVFNIPPRSRSAISRRNITF